MRGHGWGVGGAPTCHPTDWLPVLTAPSLEGRAANEASPKQKADEPRGVGVTLGRGVEVASAMGSWRALSLGGTGGTGSPGGFRSPGRSWRGP